MNVLWFAAGAFLISIVGMRAFIPRLPRAEPSGANFLQDVREGLTSIRQSNILRTFILVSLVINMMLVPVFGVAFPLLAKDEFGGARDLGILMSGLGARVLIGSISYGMIAGRIRQRSLVLGAIALMGFPLFGIATLPALWLCWILLLMMGIGAGTTNPLFQTLIQSQTPPALLGRVLGTMIAGGMIASPLGLLLGGMTISLAGLPGTLAIAGGATVATFAFCLMSRAAYELDTAAPASSIPVLDGDFSA